MTCQLAGYFAKITHKVLQRIGVCLDCRRGGDPLRRGRSRASRPTCRGHSSSSVWPKCGVCCLSSSVRRSDCVPCAPGLQMCRPVEGAVSRARGATPDALRGSRSAALRPGSRDYLYRSRWLSLSERRPDGVPCAPGLHLCRPVEGVTSRARGATHDALGGSRWVASRSRPRGGLCWSRRRQDGVSVAHRRAKVPAGPWSCHPDRPVNGAASRARGTRGEAL